MAMSFSNTHFTPLTTTELTKFAPSVFNRERDTNRTTAKFSLFNTADIIDGLAKEGFVPTFAGQNRSRSAFTKHIVRFSRVDDLNNLTNPNDERPEVVLVNAHNGTSSYRLMAGIFRLVCTNGLMVQSLNAGSIRLRHQGHTLDEVITSSLEIGNNFDQTWEEIKEMKSIKLSEKDALRFAKEAAAIRFGEDAVKAGRVLTPENLLTRHRNDDAPLTLWNVFNTVQENTMRGGVRVGRRTMRAITNIDKGVRYNTELWGLADKYRLAA